MSSKGLGVALALLCASASFDTREARAQGAVRSMTAEGVPVSWATSCVPLYLNARGRSRLNLSEIEDVLRRSALSWSDPSCALMSLVYEGESPQIGLGYMPELGLDNQNLIIFRSTQAGEQWPHDQDALALTTVTFCESDTPSCPAGTIVDADVEFNEVLYTFTTSDNGPLNDLENTLSHELGHLLGFEHSASPSSTMFAVAPAGERGKRDLSELDERGLCEAYPSQSCLACELASYNLMSRSEYSSRTSCLEPHMSASPDEGCEQRVDRSMTLALLCLITSLRLVLRRSSAYEMWRGDHRSSLSLSALMARHVYAKKDKAI